MNLYLLEDLPPLSQDTAVCLGTFDGVHLGHQVLARQTVQAARQEGLIPCAYTFDVPPASVLGAGKEDILTDIHQKAALLGACGIDTVVYSRFNRHVAQESAEEFFDLLRTRLRARHIVIGFHYHFGQFARGDAALMQSLCDAAGVRLTVVPPVRTAEGELVSSTAIRARLRAGDRLGAQSMLNRTLTEGEEQLLGGREA